MELNVLTINTRYEREDNEDKINPWAIRKLGIIELFNKYNPHLIGTQELLPWQYEQIKGMLDSNWKSFGEGRFKGGYENERNAIFYRSDIFELLEQNTIWLSETPNVVESISWNSSLPRIVTYGKFRTIKDNFEFMFFNTHLDYMSPEARTGGLKVVVNEMSKYSDLPIILTGDFNMHPDDDSFASLNKLSDKIISTYEQFKEEFGETMLTYHDFKGDKVGKPIDYIYYTIKDFKLLETKILYEKKDNTYLTDHYPVFSKFIIT